MRGIRQRSKGTWEIQIYTKGQDGKTRRYYETVKGSRHDANARRRELLTSLDKGVTIPSAKITLAEQLNNWLNGYVKTNCSPRTLEGYQSIIERHLIPALGQVQLKQLNPQAIQSYYGRACESLSARSVHHQHRVLSQALKYAVRQGYLGHNPCELVDAPSPRKKTMQTLNPSEVEALLDTAQDSYYYPIIYTAVSTGLRQAELLGLRWRDMDLDMLSISVTQVLYKRGGICEFKPPKTEHSRRRVSMTPKLASFLRDYRLDREILFRELGRSITLDDLIFADIEGRPIDPGVLSHNFNRLVKRTGLEGVRFHDLRHTFASIMLLAGAKPKVISEALGHASVAFTMDTYSHIIEGMQAEAMELLDKKLPAGKNNGRINGKADIKLNKN
jgi:integrase